MSTPSLTSGVVHLPVFQLLRDDFVQAIAGAARATSESTDDIGDYFNMTLASRVSTDAVAADAVVLVPLFNIEDGAVANSSILAAGPTMYVQFLGPPQPRMIFASCLAYSSGVECHPYRVGTRIKFPPPTHLWVAKAFLVNTINTIGAPVYVDPNADPVRAPKRSCHRPLEEDSGEPADFTRLGTSKFMMDLNGNSFSTRDKCDMGARERKLYLLFRMLERLRWEHVMGTDYTLQTEEYRNTIIQQGRTRADHKHKAFLTCSFLDRIQGLLITQNSARLELLLTGAVFVEGGLPTLELTDFVIKEELSTGDTVCPFQNRPLVAVLRNLQDALLVFFSHHFKGVLDEFITDLEGADRPLELVAADFLKYSVEETFRKYFRVIRSERRRPDSTEPPISNPEECAAYLKLLFKQLSNDLKDDPTRWVEEDYFRMRLARDRKSPKSTPSKTTPSSSPPPAVAPTPTSTSRPCAGHLGKQLKAVLPDGSLYRCKFGKTCIFKHVGKTGKTEAELLELIAQMPASTQGDLTAAVKRRP